MHFHVPTLLGLISSLWHMAPRIKDFWLFGNPFDKLRVDLTYGRSRLADFKGHTDI